MKGHLLKYFQENVGYFPQHVNVSYKSIGKTKKRRMGKYTFLLFTQRTHKYFMFFHTIGEYMKRCDTLLLIRQKNVTMCMNQVA